jgi:hypothetical protein
MKKGEMPTISPFRGSKAPPHQKELLENFVTGAAGRIPHPKTWNRSQQTSFAFPFLPGAPFPNILSQPARVSGTNN